MEYPVYFGEDEIGLARVSREGLYYCIQCICHLGDGAPFRISAKAEHLIDLGLCVPNGDISGLKVRIPMKKLGEGNPRFYIRTQDEKQQDKWYPVSPEAPFPYIAKLEKAYMVTREGKVGIAFKETD